MNMTLLVNDFYCLRTVCMCKHHCLIIYLYQTVIFVSSKWSKILIYIYSCWLIWANKGLLHTSAKHI